MPTVGSARKEIDHAHIRRARQRAAARSSASGELACVQGSNSDWSPLAGSHTDPRIIHRYAGPYPPDKTHDYTLTVYALDCELGLSEGYFLNEFRRSVRGHVLDEASLELPSRA